MPLHTFSDTIGNPTIPLVELVKSDAEADLLAAHQRTVSP